MLVRVRGEALKVRRVSKKRQGEERANGVKNKGQERGRRRLTKKNAEGENKRVVRRKWERES